MSVSVSVYEWASLSCLMQRMFLDEGAGLDSEENCYDSLEDVKKRNSGRRLLPAPPASLPLPLYPGEQSGKLSNTLTICQSDLIRSMMDNFPLQMCLFAN